jgi:hypothetical protein
MKRILICGVMLGLVSVASFAQRGRVAGGAGPTVRMPASAPVARTMPNAVTATHGSTAPKAIPATTNAKPQSPNVAGGSAATTVTPNAGNATTVAPHANTVPDRAINPDARGISDHTRVNPNQ